MSERPDVEGALARLRACASSTEVIDHVDHVANRILALEAALRDMVAECRRIGRTAKHCPVLASAAALLSGGKDG